MEINEESATLLAKKPTNAKAAIIKKLSHNWPITAKQMATILQREFGITITYQGVHKALTQLEEEKIIEKGEKGYQLDQNWIQSVSQISHNIAQNYSRNEPLDFDKEIIQLKFDNWVNAGRFGAFTFKEEFPNPENKPIITVWKHVWPVNTVSTEEAKHLEMQTKQFEHYCISPSSTPLDRLFSEWLEKLGKHNFIGANINISCDYLVRGNHIAQFHYSSNFQTSINAFYSETTDISKIDYKKLHDLVSEKNEIHVIIVKNNLLAEKLRNEILNVFKKMIK